MSEQTLRATRPVPAHAVWPRYLGIALLLAGALFALRHFLIGTPPPPRRTAQVTRGDLVSQTLATGRIVPREEIFVRSLVAGVLDELTAHPGDLVKKGDPLAVVRIVADPVVLNDARSQVKLAEQRVTHAERELTRLKPSNGGSVALSGQEVAKAEDALRIARTELDNAHERVRLVSQGTATERGTRSTRVLAPISGTVLAVPVAIGDVIGDTNSYRDGTTLAVIADMTQLLFKGQVEEAHVGKLSVGMPTTVRIGALPDSRAEGVLSWISPRATIEAASGTTTITTTGTGPTVSPLNATSYGITRFEIWVTLTEPPPNARAGYSATAALTLDTRKHVLTVEERALQFENGKVVAEVLSKEGKDQEPAPREVQVGISDGLKIEVTSGLSEGDRLLYPEDTEQ